MGADSDDIDLEHERFVQYVGAVLCESCSHTAVAHGFGDLTTTNCGKCGCQQFAVPGTEPHDPRAEADHDVPTHRYSDEFVAHAARASSQYDATCRTLAADLERTRAELRAYVENRRYDGGPGTVLREVEEERDRLALAVAETVRARALDVVYAADAAGRSIAFVAGAIAGIDLAAVVRDAAKIRNGGGGSP